MNLFGRLIPSWAIALAAAIVGALIAAGAQQVRVSALKAEHAEYRAEQQALWRQQAELTAEVQRKVAAAAEAWGREFAAMDTKHTKELTDAKSENTRLRAAARTGSVVVRIPGARCAGPAGSVPASAGTGSVGDAAVQVDAELREAVFDHRQALIEADAKIDYLQAYVRKITEPVGLGLKGSLP